MRLDKFLKVSRVIKRRTVANEACDTDRVTVNGNPAKPGKDLKVGDVVSVRFGERWITFRVKEIPTGNIAKEKAETLYEILQDET